MHQTQSIFLQDDEKLFFKTKHFLIYRKFVENKKIAKKIDFQKVENFYCLFYAQIENFSA